MPKKAISESQPQHAEAQYDGQGESSETERSKRWERRRGERRRGRQRNFRWLVPWSSHLSENLREVLVGGGDWKVAQPAGWKACATWRRLGPMDHLARQLPLIALAFVLSAMAA